MLLVHINLCHRNSFFNHTMNLKLHVQICDMCCVCCSSSSLGHCGCRCHSSVFATVLLCINETQTIRLSLAQLTSWLLLFKIAQYLFAMRNLFCSMMQMTDQPVCVGVEKDSLLFLMVNLFHYITLQANLHSECRELVWPLCLEILIQLFCYAELNPLYRMFRPICTQNAENWWPLCFRSSLAATT